jgi:predicted phosphodiesterase
MMLLVSSSIRDRHVCVAIRSNALRAVLEAEQRQEVKTVVVVTHTLLIREGLVWNSDERWNLQNGSFANSRMQTLITYAQGTKITTWCFGHSHHSADFTWSGIRFVNNSRGCPGEKRWHDPAMIEEAIS